MNGPHLIVRGQRVTTDATLRADLEASLRHQGCFAGYTWGEFKKAMAFLGVTDEDQIDSIEFGGVNASRVIKIARSDDGLEVREKR